MPLHELEQALQAAPPDAPQLRAVLALTLGRWLLAAGDPARAERFLRAALDAVPDLRPAIRLLQRIDEARADVRAIVATLDREIRATRHPREAAALYRERGRIVERHFRDLAAARQCYEAALAATPHDLAIVRSLERVALAAGDLDAFQTALETQADLVEDPRRVAAIFHELALVETRRGGDGRRAGDLLLSALEACGPTPLLVEDMLRIADALGDADLLLRAVELAAEHPGPRRTIALSRAASEFRAHKDAAAATAMLRAAARSAPDHLALWRSVEQTAPAGGRPDFAFEAALAAVRVLGREDAPLRAHAYHRAARIAIRALDRVPEAVAAVRRAIAADPTCVPALWDLRAVLEARGAWAQVLELLRLERSTAEAAGRTGTERADLHVQMGEVLADHLGEHEAARQAFAQALALRPGFRPARDRLERVLYHLGRNRELRDLLREELGQASDARATHLLSILGQLAEDAGDVEEAIATHVALLKRLPEHLPALQRLARILARTGQNDHLIKVTEQEIRLSLRPTRKAKLLHRMGELHLEAGRLDEARAAFEAAIGLVDDHAPSHEALTNVLRRQADHEALVEVLRRRLLYATDAPRRTALRMEIARMLAEQLDRPGEALEELLHLLDRRTRHLTALHAAEGLAARVGRYDTLLDLLARHAQAVQGPRTRALLLHRSAHVRLQRGDDPEAAVGDLVRALDLWPELGVARAQLLQIYERLGRTRELQSFAEGGLDSARSPAQRRALALHLAELTQRPVSAVQYLAEAARTQPSDYVTWARLARAARQARKFGRLAEALGHVAERVAHASPPDHPAHLALLYRIGRAEEAAGNLERADDAYARILDHAPGHALAVRGRRRVKAQRERPAVLVENADETETDGVTRAARFVMAAERAEHLRRFDIARSLAQRAHDAAPSFLPAVLLLSRIEARSEDPAARRRAVSLLDAAAAQAATPGTKARASCRAAEILMQEETDEADRMAAERLATALDAAPDATAPIRGLLRLSARPAPPPIPALGAALRQRIDRLAQQGTLTPSEVKVVASLASTFVGPKATADLLERAIEAAPDPALWTHLAHAKARLERWEEAAAHLEAALAAETSPERRAALDFLAAEAYERSGRPRQALEHLLRAADAGYRSKEALDRALALATAHGDTKRRAEILERLLDFAEGDERIEVLHTLATLFGQTLGQPETATSLMQQILLQRPTDLETLEELHATLLALGRPDEARAAALTSLIQHRAALRDEQARSGADPLPIDLLRAFVRLYTLLRIDDGVLVSTALLEALDAASLSAEARADALSPEPLPLPQPVEGDLIDSIAGDLDGTFILDVLRDLPPPEPPGDVTDGPSGALMPEAAPAVLVGTALARALGVALPPMYVREQPPDAAEVRRLPHPILTVGRRIASAPFVPWARARMARALFRSALGGLRPEPEAVPLLLGIAHHLASQAAPSGDLPPCPEEAASAVEALRKRLAEVARPAELAERAHAFVVRHQEQAGVRLLRTLRAAEDRLAVTLAGDPRPVLTALGRTPVPSTRQRIVDLATFVLSEEHLDLRIRLGYARTIIHPPRKEVAS